MTQNPLEQAAKEGLEKAAAYGRDVMSGKQVACKWVRLAVQRHYDDLDNGHHRGLLFDESRAARVLVFFKFLKHSKGQWAGKPLELEPWQCWLLSCMFGWVHEGTGSRRFSTAYLEVPRKNGKSTLLAGLGLYGLIKDDEGGAEIYSAATKKDQAKVTFDEAVRMVGQSPALKKRIKDFRNNLHVPGTASKFEPLSADAHSLDGLNPHFSLVDELHAHKTSEVWDVLDSGDGAREQPFIIAITTAGFNKQGVCYAQRDYVTKLLQGIVKDDSYFGAIYTCDEGDRWDQEETWRKANPNFGVSVLPHKLQEKAERAAQMPTAMTNFLTKRLNMWVNAETLWMNIPAWEECGLDYDIEALEGLTCYGGLDLASTSDICSFGIVGITDQGKRRSFCRHYLPEDAVSERVEKNQVPYDVWAREGWLTLTPGNVTDYNFIKRDIGLMLEQLNIVGIGFDRWNSSQLVNDLMDEGAPMVGFGQGFGSMNPAMKELERLVLAREIEHRNDPVLTWAMSNLVAKEDEAGNIKPAKNKSKEKIDPAVALIEAVGISISEETQGPSIYEDRDLVVI